MPDVDRLRKAIRDFLFYSRPSNAVGSSLCTVDDLNQLIDRIAKMMNVFLTELEEKE